MALLLPEGPVATVVLLPAVRAATVVRSKMVPVATVVLLPAVRAATVLLLPEGPVATEVLLPAVRVVSVVRSRVVPAATVVLLPAVRAGMARRTKAGSADSSRVSVAVLPEEWVDHRVTVSRNPVNSEALLLVTVLRASSRVVRWAAQCRRSQTPAPQWQHPRRARDQRDAIP